MSNYEERAIKFATFFTKYLKDCNDLDDFIHAIKLYNLTHTNKLSYEYGVSRIAIIRSDYVIKFEYQNDEEGFQNGEAGNNITEAEVYEQACIDGFEYLLAKTTLVEINDIQFAIMPRINHINDYDKDYTDFLTCEEHKWLRAHVYDIHYGNVGYKNRKPVIIDYAWSTAL